MFSTSPQRPTVSSQLTGSAGIVNVLTHAREVFPSVPLQGAMGRAAPVGVDGEDHPGDGRRPEALRARRARPRPLHRLAGDERLAREFGDELVPSAVGKRYLF